MDEVGLLARRGYQTRNRRISPAEDKKGGYIMKKTLIIVALVLAAGFILVPSEGHAQMGPGYGPGPEEYEEWNYCPHCGQPLLGPGYERGPGMMGPGYGRGYGMRGPGWGMGHGMMNRYWDRDSRYGFQYQQPQEPLGEKEAKETLENYLKSTRNPNLKLGKIKDRDSYFEAEVLTKDDSLVDKLAVDKNTGWMRSIY
jgi:hypothetical protein